MQDESMREDKGKSEVGISPDWGKEWKSYDYLPTEVVKELKLEFGMSLMYMQV